jgi:cyclase
MLKKRLIFTLLYDSGHFMLSRNFNLQRVGDVNWLAENYNFSSIAFSIDELIILDVSREKREMSEFIEAVKQITKECFVPVSAGGGVKNLSDATLLLKSGADKVVLNSLVFEDSKEVSKISQKFGAQSIVASIDLKKEGKKYQIYTSNGEKKIDNDPKEFLKMLKNFNIGEVFLNSIDKDGTAQGLDLGILDLVDDNFNLPLILGGGAGHHNHLFEAFSEEKVDAVSTAHLFNFVGDGLEKCRVGLISKGMNLAKWDKPEI